MDIIFQEQDRIR